jgi:hypothetical protein
MKKLYLLLILGVVVLLEGQAQSVSWRIEGKSLMELRREQGRAAPLPNVFVPFYRLHYLSPFSTRKKGLNRMLLAADPLPGAYRYEDLAFFCRIEVQMERAFKFPVKFRLGEVQYVERMEGKY